MKDSYLHSKDFTEKTRGLIKNAVSELRKKPENRTKVFSETFLLIGWIEGTLLGIETDNLSSNNKSK